MSRENDRAGGDWVVAIFPRFFEQVRSATGLKEAEFLDVGSAGFNGFINHEAAKYDFKYLNGGHAVALAFDHNKAQAKSIAQFILSPQLTAEIAPPNLVTEPNKVVRLLGQLAWLVWSTILALIIIGAVLTWRARLFRKHKYVAIATYFAIVLIALNIF
jgi:hypothetical protein